MDNKDYDLSIYDRPSVTVDSLVFTVVNEESNNYRKLPKRSLKYYLLKENILL